jgi:hypothetical protein
LAFKPSLSTQLAFELTLRVTTPVIIATGGDDGELILAKAQYLPLNRADFNST